MTRAKSIQTASGKTFYVIAGQYSFAEISVPSDQIDDMTNEEIGAAIRELMPQALFLGAVEQADYFYQRHADKIQRPWALDPDDIIEYEPMFRSHTGQNDYIDKALRIIDAYHAYQDAKEQKSGKRREIAIDYDSILVALGRRDGFRCQHCRSSDNLQIDHITPLVRGGTNDLHNLQLLCGPCNLRKGGN